MWNIDYWYMNCYMYSTYTCNCMLFLLLFGHPTLTYAWRILSSSFSYFFDKNYFKSQCIWTPSQILKCRLNPMFTKSEGTIDAFCTNQYQLHHIALPSWSRALDSFRYISRMISTSNNFTMIITKWELMFSRLWTPNKRKNL